MRKLVCAVLLSVALPLLAQQPQQSNVPVTLKSVLLLQLHETHNQKNWFVSEKEAVAGLTGEQAAWSDGKNHSVGQLLAHLNYWNGTILARLKGLPVPSDTDNDKTFAFDAKQWDAAQKKFDETMTEIEGIVESADDAALQKMAPTIARTAMHNAYHIGEMVTSRKKQGSWNPENGVK